MGSIRAVAPALGTLEVPEELKKLPAWLIWRAEEHTMKNGERKLLKVPYWVNGVKRHGLQGSPQDRANLTTFAAARDAAVRKGFTGVGFAPLADWGYTFLDFDHCVGPSGEIPEEVLAIVGRTYAEYSPSGKGIRAALKGSLGNRKSKATPDQYGFETFSSSGFVTFTGNILPTCEILGYENHVAEVDQRTRDLCDLRFQYSEERAHDPDDFMAGREPRLGLSISEMEFLVNQLDPDMGRDDWIRVGMALHHETEGGDDGFDIWDEWSEGGDTYPGTDGLRVQWDSFERRAGPGRRQVTMASVKKMVKEATRPDEAVSREEVLAKAEAIMAALPEKAERGRFGLQPIHELAMQKPVEWLIKGVLPKAELGVLFGASGSGKTFVALDLAFAVARGLDWRGHRTRKGRVAIIAAEGGSGIGKRAEAYASYHCTPLNHVDIHVITAAPNFLLDDDVAEIIAELKASGPWDLIIIDTLAQVTPGANENTSEDMGKAIAHMKLIHEATVAMVLAVHHAGKDLTRGSRGWSGLKGATDVQIEVLRHDDGRREIHLEKMKDGEDGLRWGFKLETLELGLDEDGDPITSCVAVESDLPVPANDDDADRKSIKRRGRVETHILEIATQFGAQSTVKLDEFVRVAANALPDPEPGKRDTRRQSIVRALGQLTREKDGPLQVNKNLVIFYE